MVLKARRFNAEMLKELGSADSERYMYSSTRGDGKQAALIIFSDLFLSGM